MLQAEVDCEPGSIDPEQETPTEVQSSEATITENDDVVSEAVSQVMATMYGESK